VDSTIAAPWNPPSALERALYTQALRRLGGDARWRIVWEAPDAESAEGFNVFILGNCDHRTLTVALDPGLPPALLYRVFLHEAGHAYTYYRGGLLPSEPEPDKRQNDPPQTAKALRRAYRDDYRGSNPITGVIDEPISEIETRLRGRFRNPTPERAADRIADAFAVYAAHNADGDTIAAKLTVLARFPIIESNDRK